jgi:hypothetical protein
MDLSIVTPAAPKRKPRIASMFNRLKLNAQRHPEIKFEFIIVDDSLDQEYQWLASQDWGFPVKYISLPLTEPYPNPSYMRNVGFRVAEGVIFTMLDADHWVHEDFVVGALDPFKVEPVLNTGFMIDTSKGNKFHPHKTNELLINSADYMLFDQCMFECGIKGPVEWRKVWLAAYPAEKFLSINGYDEKYVAGYSREDDDIYYRLASVCTGIYNMSFKTFAGVHLWHPQAARSDAKNEANRKYYAHAQFGDAVRNKGHQWGKFVRGSFSIINGIRREHVDHEDWITTNNPRISQTWLGDEPWDNFTDLQRCVK